MSTMKRRTSKESKESLIPVNHPSWEQKVDLYVQLPNQEFVEVIKGFDAPFFNYLDKGQSELRVFLMDILSFVKDQGFALENTQVSYYSQVFGAFINCCLYPVSKTIWLAHEDFELIDNTLALRLQFGQGLKWQFTEQETAEDDSDKKDESGARGKERSIGYVIEQVTKWRKLYNGYYDDEFNHFRMSLE